MNLLRSLTTTAAAAAMCATVARAQTSASITTNLAMKAPTMLDLLELTGLDGKLGGGGPFTVFAPTDEAWENLPPGILDFLKANTGILAGVLNYHFSMGSSVALSELSSSPATTLLTNAALDLTITRDDAGEISVGGTAQLVETDIVASNGVIHTVDTVIISSVLQNIFEDNLLTVDGILDQNFPLYSNSLQSIGVGDMLLGEGPFTVFAPTDEAVLAFLRTINRELDLTQEEFEQVLLYYIVDASAIHTDDVQSDDRLMTMNGQEIWFEVHDDASITVHGAKSSANIVRSNMVGSNGVVHMIDYVLQPETERSFIIGEPTSAPTSAPVMPTPAPVTAPTLAPMGSPTSAPIIVPDLDGNMSGGSPATPPSKSKSSKKGKRRRM